MRYSDMTTDQKLSALAADMEKCEIAMGLLKPRAARKFKSHRDACWAEINRLLPVDPQTNAMSTDELLAELTA